MNRACVLKFCRLCLCSSGSLLDIFMENSPYESFVPEAIEDLLHFKMVKEDFLPWIICHSCLVRLCEFRDFKKRCVRSKFVFHSMFQLGVNEILQPTPKYKRKEQEMRSKDGGTNHSEEGFPLVYFEDNSRAGDIDEPFHGLSCDDAVMSPPFEEAGDDDVGSVVEFCWCSKCGEEFLSVRELKGHARWCVEKWKLTGNSLSGECKEEEMVDLTDSIRQQPLDPNTCCMRCRKRFRTKERLIRHINKYDFKCKEKGIEGSISVAETPGNVERSEMSSLEHVMTHEQQCVSTNENSHTQKSNLRCSICQKIFQSLEHLEFHMKKHDEKCKDVCIQYEKSTVMEQGVNDVSSKSKGLDFTAAYQQSSSSDHSNLNKTYTDTHLCCSSCGLVFESEKLLTQHLNNCSSGVNVKSRENLDLNIKGKQECSSRMLCNVQGCVKITNMDSSATVHEKNNTNLGSCMLKGGPSGVPSVSVDMRIIGVDTNMSYVCDYCEKPFTLKPDLRNHIVKCHLSLDPQKCPVCHRLFMNKEELEEHSHLHPRDKKFYCTVCEESFPYRNMLKKHIVRRHNVNSGFICSICFNGFTCRADLGVHQTLVHTESEKRFKCHVCGKSYMDKEVYKGHVKLCQLKTVSFQCNICGKKMTTKNNLDIHFAIHLNLKKYVCNLCGKAFTQSGTRNLHVRAFHLKIRPYECKICNKWFLTKGGLNQHHHVHSDERPFNCPECPKSFKSKFALRDHIRRLHMRF